MAFTDPIQRSRVNETDPSPYDQIFVLNQHIINEGFKACLIQLRSTPQGRESKFVQYNLQGWRLTFKTRIGEGEHATFAPSNIDYAPYAWIDPGHPSVAKDGSDKNALAILTYVNRAKGNGYEPAGLRHHGVFTDEGAAFCMNQDLFWEIYLLPALQFINKSTEVVPQDPPTKYRVEVKYALGKSAKPGSDAAFRWKRQIKNEQTYWAWKGGQKERVTKWNDGMVTYYQYTQDAQSSTQVTFSPGGRDIHQIIGVI
ncbi:hypothetical protein UA08_02128 [Talaromyces atroroseus]|uniref:Uncharacterized protein n=1 Tax=Talaromyces atroroseus TaxID=1441469 RepID=A0A1Q5QAS2_TALAT|nr:hypothetical protein UA08_02128 [Talaromyces atroroseus]OKL62869.1 hypothetical protein UA08_02128 [Talaromyces atroroseus]